MKTISAKRKFYNVANKMIQYKMHSISVDLFRQFVKIFDFIFKFSLLSKLMEDHTNIIENSILYRGINKLFYFINMIIYKIGHKFKFFKQYSKVIFIVNKCKTLFWKRIISFLLCVINLILYLVYINIYEAGIESTIILVAVFIIILSLGFNSSGFFELYKSSCIYKLLIYMFSTKNKNFELQWLMMFIVFVIPILPKTVSMVLIIGISIIKLISTLMKEKTIFKLDVLIFAIVLYYIMVIIATGTSTNRIASIRDFVIHTVGIFWAVTMIISIKDRRELNSLMTMFVYVASLIGLYGILQYFLGIEMDAAWVDTKNNPDLSVRVYSVFGNPNILGEYLIMALPISIAMFFINKGFLKKIVFIGTSGILTLSLLMTFSRGAWLGFGVAFIAMVLLFRKELIFLFIPTGIISMFLLPDSIVNRILSIGNIGDSSNAYRIRVWKVALQMIRDNWIFGVGLGYLPFKVNYLNYIRTMNVYHSHNMFLEIFAEMGIGGFMAMLFLFSILFKKLYSIIRKRRNMEVEFMALGLIGSMIAVITNGLTENILYLPKIIWTFWMIVGFSGILIRLENQKSFQTEDNCNG